MQRKSCWRLGAIVAVFVGAVVASAGSEDFVEFRNVTEAKTFGWKAKGKTDAVAFTVVRESQSGRYALRVDAGKNAGAYSGFLLRRRFDLTGAGPGDKIVFHVKQNYGSGICLNMVVGGTSVYRYAKIQANQWTRVEMDLDRKNWTSDKGIPWGEVHGLSLYSNGFDKEGEYMILDGFSVQRGGVWLSAKAGPGQSITKWQFPYETRDAWYLGNSDTAWAISKTTGQVTGGWNVRTKELYLHHTEGRYHLEDIKEIVTGRESKDQILSADFVRQGQKVILVCTNPFDPNLTIKKEYRLDGSRLFKQTAFSYKKDIQKFITNNSEVALAPDYRDGGYYMGAGFVGPLVPAPQLGGWTRVTAYRNTSKGLFLHQPERGYSFAHIRTRLDGNFVWPWFSGAISGYVEQMNTLHYTPDGWDMALCTSPLSPKVETSYEEFFAIIPGDWHHFLTKVYPALPEVQAELKEIPPVPAWVAEIKASCGFGRDGMARLRRLVETTDEGIIIVMLGSWGSWADYYVEEGLVGLDGGFITGPELRDLIRRIKAVSPRIKIGIYQWVLSASYESRIYKQHPEWFRTLTKEGELASTFPGAANNFASLLSNPECYQELLAHFDRVLSYLETDYIYLDDPKAVNMVDWHSNQHTRDDLSYKFLLDLKRLVARHGADKMLFFNCRGNPYGDINFIEARGQLRAGWWRDFVGIGSCIEGFLACRPQARIIPLYWIDSLAREYVNRTLALGWIPSMTYGDVVGRRPYTQAAYEMGNSSPLAGRYSPDWKHDAESQVESYFTRRVGDTGYILSLISHEQARKKIPVTIEFDSLELDKNERLVVWDHVVENAQEYKGRVTERLAKSVYAATGWHLDRVAQRKLLYAGEYLKKMTFDLSMDPLLLHQLYITTQPAAVYAEENLPNNYLFNSTRQVRLQGSTDHNAGTARIEINSLRDTAEILAYVPQDRRLKKITVDGQDVTPVWVFEGETILPVVQVKKGAHVMLLEYEPQKLATAKASFFGVSIAGKDLALSVPGYRHALVTLEQNGCLLFNRMLSGQDGLFTAPMPPSRPGGKYTVKLAAVADSRGRIQLVKGVEKSLELPDSVPDLKMTSKYNPRTPVIQEVKNVNKTVQGLTILRSAINTTSTPITGWQPKLTGLTVAVAPDTLTMEAGTTRKIQSFLGAAFAGLEIKNLRKVKVKLTNTFHNAFHGRGEGIHNSMYHKSTREFAGIVVDYHTPGGYAKRVGFGVGVLHSQCNTSHPQYGKASVFDDCYDLGDIVNQGPEKIFALDLERYAPKDWDGQVWFSVGSDWVASDRRLKLQIVAANDQVTGGFLSGSNPKDLLARYRKPKAITIPRAPIKPIIDGAPDDEMWQVATVLDDFFLLAGVGISKAKTQVKIFYDDKNLYFGFICDEPDRRRPLIKHGSIWHDDEIEIYIDANCDQKTFTQVLVNGIGKTVAFRDTLRADIGTTAVSHIEEGRRWMLEVVIPYAGMGVKPPKRGDTWRINVVRQRLPGKGFNHELITWAPVQKSFRDLEYFGTMTFK